MFRAPEPSVWHRLFARLAIAGNAARALGTPGLDTPCPMRALVRVMPSDELDAFARALEGGGQGAVPRPNPCSSPAPPMRRLLEPFAYASDPHFREERDVKAMIGSAMKNADPEAYGIVLAALAQEKARRG